jgi:hypothetical protein
MSVFCSNQKAIFHGKWIICFSLKYVIKLYVQQIILSLGVSNEYLLAEQLCIGLVCLVALLWKLLNRKPFSIGNEWSHLLTVPLYKASSQGPVGVPWWSPRRTESTAGTQMKMRISVSYPTTSYPHHGTAVMWPSNAAFKTLRVSGRTFSSEESALNTPLGQRFRSEFRAEVKQPESSQITSQQWLPVSLMD